MMNNVQKASQWRRVGFDFGYDPKENFDFSEVRVCACIFFFRRKLTNEK
jgi:hypothetical protein